MEILVQLIKLRVCESYANSYEASPKDNLDDPPNKIDLKLVNLWKVPYQEDLIKEETKIQENCVNLASF